MPEFLALPDARRHLVRQRHAERAAHSFAPVTIHHHGPGAGAQPPAGERHDAPFQSHPKRRIRCGRERGVRPLSRPLLRLLVAERLIGDPARHRHPTHHDLREHRVQDGPHSRDLHRVGGPDDDPVDVVKRQERHGGGSRIVRE
jgi:hypothetical protein